MCIWDTFISKVWEILIKYYIYIKASMMADIINQYALTFLKLHSLFKARNIFYANVLMQALLAMHNS